MLKELKDTQVVFAGFYLFVWYQACRQINENNGKTRMHVKNWEGGGSLGAVFWVDICR